MPTLGKTATPNSGTHGYILGSQKQVGMLFTVPAGGGLFQSVSFWAATTTSGYIWGVIWDSGGTVLVNGVGVNTSGGAQNGTGPGGDGQFHTDTFTTPKYIAGGTSIYIGWQNNDATNTYWAYNGGDHSPNAEWRGGVTGSPASFSGHSAESPSGAVAAYATYILAGGNVYRSGVWTPTEVDVRRSGANNAAAGVWVYRSGVWQPGS
jgi:hypothetical protein